MNSRKLKLESLKEGMKVSADVRNMDDMLLIPAGCELTPRHIKVLQTWGVEEVSVESSSESEDARGPLEKLPPETLERLRSETLSQFLSPQFTHPIQEELFRILLLRRARKLIC